jgi:hypothetical protein
MRLKKRVIMVVFAISKATNRGEDGAGLRRLESDVEGCYVPQTRSSRGVTGLLCG